MGLRGHQGKVQAVAFDPAGDRFVTGGADGRVLVRDRNARQTLATQVRSRQPVEFVQYVNHNRLLACAFRDGWVRAYDPATGRVAWDAELDPGGVTAMTYDPGRWLLAAAGKGGKVRVWADRTGKLRGELAGHTRPVQAPSFQPPAGGWRPRTTAGRSSSADVPQQKKVARGVAFRGPVAALWSYRMSTSLPSARTERCSTRASRFGRSTRARGGFSISSRSVSSPGCPPRASTRPGSGAGWWTRTGRSRGSGSCPGKVTGAHLGQKARAAAVSIQSFR